MIKIDLEKNFNIHTKYKVIHSPVDLDMINRLSTIEADIPNEGFFTLINVAGFRQQKNHDLLIEAMNKIRHLPVRLLLLGKGALEESSKAKVRALNLRQLGNFLI